MTGPKRKRPRSLEARKRRAAKRRSRQHALDRDAIAFRIQKAQDQFLAGDVGELSDFELKILDTIHGDD